MRVSQIAIDASIRHQAPEQIQEEYSHSSLAQIHAALAYYYSHKEEIEAIIVEEDRYVAELKANGTPATTVMTTRTELEARRNANRLLESQ